MNIEKKSLILLCCLNMSSAMLYAQQEDFQGIFAFGIEKKISPSFSLSFYNEERFNQNLSELGYSFFDGGINYKIDRHWTLGANYRYIFLRNLNNEYRGRSVVYGDVSYSKSISKFSFVVRARIQTAFHPLVTNETQQNSVTYNRDRLTIRYRYNYYIVPFVYGELFVPIDHPTHEYLDRIRYCAGFNYNFNDHLKVEVYYQISQEFNQSNKKTNYALGMQWHYRL
jgi:hypothetical protein